jgi:dihydroorotase
MHFNFPIIDMHTHLRNNIPKHTKLAKQSGIDAVVYMANCNPPLDSLDRIKKSFEVKRYCKTIPIGAITKNLEGKKLVEVDEMRTLVAGFSDDGKYLKNLDLLQNILRKGVLVLAHCCPSYEEGIKNPELETEFIKRYLSVLEKTGGKLHIQHISRKKSVDLIRNAKQRGIKVSCETCPHYFTYTRQDLDVKINPPLASEEDVLAIKKGLSDGTIDVIASDYAPEPRETGIAGFRSFIPLSYGLVLERVLTKAQLKEKLYINPKRILESAGYEFK